jgi:hypothetical protein
VSGDPPERGPVDEELREFADLSEAERIARTGG